MTVGASTGRIDWLMKPSTRNRFRLFVSAFALLASTVVHALEAEPLDVVTTQLHETWASSCITLPLGSHEFTSEAASDRGEEEVLSFDQAMNLKAWGATDALTVTFSNRDGELTPNPIRDGGTLLVELAVTNDPLIKIAEDGSSACLRQGTFETIHPTSIVPVVLDDGRPGRIYFFTYKANWSPAVAQRYGMDSSRIAAALVSFKPGVGWDRVETFRTEDKGQQFSPDIFKGDGLSHFDFEATHPDTIEFHGVPVNYPASAQPLTARYKTPVPANVAACRERDHWEMPACLENLAQGGAILGALSICRRDDVRCLVDLLYAFAPGEIADQCLDLQDGSPSSFSRCQAFAALHGPQAKLAEAMPNWRTTKLVRSQGSEREKVFFLRAHSVEYGSIEEFEISQRERTSGTPYVTISCNAGLLGASALFTAHPSLWRPGEHVAANMQGRWDEDNDFTLVADEDGTTLAVEGSEVERFVRHALSSESFRLTISGSAIMRAHVSVRDVVSAFGGGMDLPTLLSEEGCSKAVERALQ